MEKKFEDLFCKIEYSHEKNCIYHYWKPTTKTAEWVSVKNDFIQYVDAISITKSNKVIVDEREMYPVFSPEEQKWVDNVFKLCSNS